MKGTVTRESRIKGIMYASVAALMWSTVAIALKVSVSDLPPVNIVWFRFAAAFAVIFIYHAVKRPQDLKILAKPPLLLLVAAAALGFNYLFILIGVDYTSPNTVQIIIQFGPILLAVSGFVIYRERIDLSKVIGFALAIGGLMVFYSQQSSILIHDIANFNAGFFWTLLAAVGWAMYAVIQKRLVRDRTANQLNLVIYGLPILMFIFFVDFGAFLSITAVSWGVLVFLVINTLVAYTAIALALKYAEANIVSIVITVNPILTFIFMEVLKRLDVSWIGKERFVLVSYVGAAMVLTGAAIIVGYNVGEKSGNGVETG